MRLSLTIPEAAARPFDVAGFGLNSVDLLAVVAEFPALNSKQRLQRLTRLPGGQIATAMATCARLGWRASYVGSFGSDDLGTLSRGSLIDAGVDVSASRTVAGATNQFAIILVDAQSGARTVLWDRHPDLAWSPARCRGRHRHGRTHADRGLPRDRGGDAGRPMRPQAVCPP